MNVIAISTPGQPDWRWRIVDYRGGTVEESYTSVPTIITRTGPLLFAHTA
jgi:hypothetical protein